LTKKTICILAILCGLYAQTRAQADNEMNKLYAKLQTSTHDTIKLALLKDIVEHEVSEKKAALYNKEAFDLCFKLLKSPQEKIVQKALYVLPLFINNNGYFAESTDDYHLAFDSYFKAQELAARVKNYEALGQSYNNIGYTLAFTDKNQLSKAYFDSALVTYERINDSEQIAYAINNLLFLYKEGEKLDEQMALIKKVLKYKEVSNDHIGLVNIYNNYGLLYSYKAMYDSAMFMFNKSLKIAQSDEMPHGEALVYYQMARNYLRQKQYKEAEKYFIDTYNICSSNASKDLAAKAALELSLIYKATNRLTELEKYKDEVEAAKNILKSQSEKRNFNINLEEFQRTKKIYADSVLAVVLEAKPIQTPPRFSLLFAFGIGSIIVVFIWALFYILRPKRAKQGNV
jgi:tetratricopeptide (TPR) repeat protein